MSHERIEPWGSADPDDLAALLYASLLSADEAPKVQIERTTQGTAIAIEVCAHRGDRDVVVARLPMYPVSLDDNGAAAICAAVEFAGRLWNRRAP